MLYLKNNFHDRRIYVHDSTLSALSWKLDFTQSDICPTFKP